LHFAHVVDVGAGFGVDHVTQQGDFLGGVHTVHADGGVVGLGRVGDGVGASRGVVQHGVEAVHDGLHFGGGVGLGAGDVGIVQGVVDGR
jgi:hypothetical protein